MAYSKVYAEEIKLADILKTLRNLGFDPPSDIESEKKTTTFISKNSSGIQFQFSIENNYTLKFDLNPPISWPVRILQSLLSFGVLMGCIILKKEILKGETGIILGVIQMILLLVLAVSAPNLLSSYFYKMKNQEELNILASQLDNLDNEDLK